VKSGKDKWQPFWLGYTLAIPWVQLGYNLGGVCKIRGKGIKNLRNRKRNGIFFTDK
jgi:hypothetical protein